MVIKKDNDITVIEYVIEKCKSLQCSKIIAGIYECAENEPLVKKLKQREIEVVYSKKDVTDRFVDIVLAESAKYCIRVSGDQLLFDVEETLHILNEMKNRKLDFYYEESNNCILPDIVSVECLKKYEKEIGKHDRYFHALIKDNEVKRYSPKPLMIMFNFRANSNEGYRVCSNIIRNSLNIYDLSNRLANRIMKSNYLCTSGLLGSWIITSNYSDFYYDEEKNINPWMGKTFIDFIKKYLTKEMSVFEWGIGNSTLFWSKYVKEVVSVVYDQKWYEKIREIVSENVRARYYKLEYDGAYCKAILEEEQKFDIVFIDGRDRVRCAKNAVLGLKENGIIIWDNIDRSEYQEGIDFLKEEGFKNITISGVIYGVPGLEGYTAIFYKQKNILNL